METLAEIIGHGLRIELLGHDPRSSAEDVPCEQRSDKRVAEARPCSRGSVEPAELSGIAYKDNSREI